MRCLWCVKYSRQCKTMPSGPREFIPPFIPVTRMKCSYGKISSPLTEISVGKTEISGTEPARPLIWTHSNYEGFRGKARSRKSGSCEGALSRPGSVRSPYPNKKFLKVPILTARRVREKKCKERKRKSNCELYFSDVSVCNTKRERGLQKENWKNVQHPSEAWEKLPFREQSLSF